MLSIRYRVRVRDAGGAGAPLIRHPLYAKHWASASDGFRPGIPDPKRSNRCA